VPDVLSDNSICDAEAKNGPRFGNCIADDIVDRGLAKNVGSEKHERTLYHPTRLATQKILIDSPSHGDMRRAKLPGCAPISMSKRLGHQDQG
jgi:hypothetical protein